MELKSPLQETRKDKLQALLVFAALLYVLWLAISSLSDIVVKSLDIASYVKIQTDTIKVGNVNYFQERIGYSKYIKPLPSEFQVY